VDSETREGCEGRSRPAEQPRLPERKMSRRIRERICPHRRFRQFPRFIPFRSGFVNSRCYFRNRPKKWASSAPSAAIRIPEAVSWLTVRPPQPCSIAHSLSERSQPTTCHRHDPAGEPSPPTAKIARHTASRAASMRRAGPSASLPRVGPPSLGRDQSGARNGSSWAAAKRVRKSSPA